MLSEVSTTSKVPPKLCVGTLTLQEKPHEIVPRINFAEQQTEEGDSRLKAALDSRKLQRSKVLQAQELTTTSLKRKEGLQKELETVEAKLQRLG